MDVQAQRPAADLFDNPVFSDLTVAVISSKVITEYKVHKAILSQGSGWFYEKLATTDQGFRDIVVECDDIPLFEFLLRSMYSGQCDTAALNKLASDKGTQLVVMLIRLYHMVKQYKVTSVSEHVLNDVRGELTKASHDLLDTAIKEAFKDNTLRDTGLENMIASTVLKNHRGFVTRSEQYRHLLEEYAVFAVAMAIALSNEALSNDTNSIAASCPKCSCEFTIQSFGRAMLSPYPQYCPSCKESLPLRTRLRRG